MSGKLKDYQVVDVFCGGTFYKVRHKVTNNIFAWKAYDCSVHTDEQIHDAVNEVRTISRACADNVLRYYDTILHKPTKTLYFVVEYVPWRSLQHLLEECKAADKHFAECFLWLLLHELARACKAVADLSVVVLRKCISPATVFVSDKGELRVNCFEWASSAAPPADPMHQVGALVRTLCLSYLPGATGDNMKRFRYSDDLQDVVSFLAEERSSSGCLHPDVLLYHPTVLSNLETLTGPICIGDILIQYPVQYPVMTSQVNKCDSEKVGELCRAVEPLPRTIFNVGESPIYGNISSKRQFETEKINSNRESLSPTLAALALELPGFVPRSRKPYSEAMEVYSRPKLVSDETFSQEWMTRLVALRQREQSLNQRERELIAKEIVSSPNGIVIPLSDRHDSIKSDSNGITLPPLMAQREWASRRRRRSGSLRPRTRTRRKSYGYEELDSSLSADAGDGSMIITATKFTKETMPRRNIFPEVSTKKVHFTAANPFVGSDESVTLTFYELDKADTNSKQQQKTNSQKEINKFKYLDLEKITSEKRLAMNWSHSSPSKQAKITKSAFTDISNESNLRKTPSKTSITSDCSRFSMMSAKSHWSMESSISKVSDSGVFERTRSGVRRSVVHTPVAPPDVKKKSRRSLLPFKTPFKFMSKS